MRVELNVLGMKCERCVDKIEKFVGEIDGVLSIDVRLADQKVIIECEDFVNKEDIKEAILDSGFEVV